MNAKIIPFQRIKDCKGMSLIEIHNWLKENKWENVRFKVYNLDHLIAERLPK